jgi:AbrB family looped-hinge helix DNA binding protein
MLTSKISQKGQVTIPKEIRKTIGANAGDLIEYEIQDNLVVIRRVEPFDRSYHAALQSTLSEWTSEEDEKAFRDL